MQLLYAKALSAFRTAYAVVALCAPYLAVALATSCFLIRLTDIGSAPFLQDEPQFLFAARRALQHGWPSHSPIAGTTGSHYGPSIVWFYSALMLVVGIHPKAIIWAMALLVTLSQLFFVNSLHHRLGRSNLWALAMTLLFVSSSPYEFFWSRLAWDQTTNFLPFLALPLLLSARPGVVRSLAFGLFAGLSFSSHPMCLPLWLICFAWYARACFRHVCLMVGGFFLVNIPWLVYLLNGARPPKTSFFSLSIPTLRLQRFTEGFRPHSTSGVQYFFDSAWPNFHQAHAWETKVASSQVTLWIAAFCILTGLYALLRHPSPGMRLLATIACFSAALYPFVYGQLQLDFHPHYQFPLIWIGCLGIAGLFYSRSRRFLPLKALALMLAISNLFFITTWKTYVAANSGLRDIHYGTILDEQMRVVDQVCKVPLKHGMVINKTNIFNDSLQYLASVSCPQHTVDVCSFKRCVAPHYPLSLWLLSYANQKATDGRLQLNNLNDLRNVHD